MSSAPTYENGGSVWDERIQLDENRFAAHVHTANRLEGQFVSGPGSFRGRLPLAFLALRGIIGSCELRD